MTSEASLGTVNRSGRVQEHTRAIQNQIHAIFLPLNVPGIAVLPENHDWQPVDAHGTGFFVQFLDDPASPETINIASQGTVSAVPFQIVGYVFEPLPHVSSYIDNEFPEDFSGHMVPEREFPDTAEAVDAQLHRRRRLFGSSIAL